MAPLTTILREVLVVTVLLIMQLWIETAVACETHQIVRIDQSHWFTRVGIGTQGAWLSSNSEWVGDDAIAFTLAVGYRWGNGWDTQYGHNSHVNRGDPVNDKPEDELDSLTAGYEWRWK